MTSALLSLDDTGDPATLRLSGRLVTETLASVEMDFRNTTVQAPALQIDLSGLDAMDTGGAWLIADLQARLEKQGVRIAFSESDTPRTDLIAKVAAALPKEEGIEDRPRGIIPWITGIGETTANVGRSMVSLLSFMGEVLSAFAATALRPRRWRPAALVSQMEETGLNAIPIVVLMSFLIGVVLSFQGAAQLRQFGAEVFVVDLIAISILRELGILLTAIIVAGRSGSAFTASIGSMKVREELDAMRTLGLDPIVVLVLPRVIALVIVLPILGFIANISGLVGGALMSWAELNVSPGMFITRLHENTDIWHLAIGMIKAPVFAAIIATVACWQAMQVRGSADSVGRHTTISVVQSIFLVIAADALFSILFAELGL
ncbi:ABC transporter permease [Roseobacter sinensis]|uniref:MlaE family lipid ABC transporter permease subunit n=1 Tax=Roseobacter sinensis TaxID=2931391 RepID=A0ABT3BBZ7_9RHOB|nr:MlaE family lipid ABC transporter permease subunit [Roseobacter sp. WL0113]MCV3270689.1 MlaE family lipid ABC transporter permease subunit [Roseobacter sp. WL0113]